MRNGPILRNMIEDVFADSWLNLLPMSIEKI